MLSSERVVDQLAKTIATLRAVGVKSRGVHSLALREILSAHPLTLAVWCAWEADAFDGRDAEFRNTSAHDETGRFLPYWHRADGAIACEPVTGCGRSLPGDWHSATRRYGQASSTDKPFLYPVAGRPRWITSEVIPLLERGRFVGVAGVDYAATPTRRAMGQTARGIANFPARKHPAPIFKNLEANCQYCAIVGSSS